MIPWVEIACGYFGFCMYLLFSVKDASDESFGSIGDIFFNRGRTVLVGALSVLALTFILREMDQLSWVSAFFGGYANVSMFRKIADSHMAKNGGTK